MKGQPSEIVLFLRRCIAHPKRVGAILPSGPALGRLVAKHAVQSHNDVIVELGSGTGTVTRGLLDAGFPEDRLVLIELDRDLVHYLRRTFPRARIIAGDAMRPYDTLPPELRGRVDTLVCGVPMLPQPLDQQRAFIEQCFAVLNQNGRLFQYTYSPKSPLPRAELDLDGKRLGIAMANVPPAHLWSYRRARAPMAQAAE